MEAPKIAVVSFPGNNCEVESIRAIQNAGMEAVFFRWNDNVTKLKDVDGYFIPGGFSYEDRGRAGMVAARDPLLQHIKEEAAKGKVVIGNCNGAQVLVESGLIPNAEGLEMSLARNVYEGKSTGFINEWIYITPECDKERCCTSNWEGVMHIPLAHGEGRFTTTDKTLWKKLLDNNQLAFSYCDEQGNSAPENSYNPNGSEMAAAGICNPEGNVVALMPHPERTPKGDAYFVSVKEWILRNKNAKRSGVVKNNNTEPVSYSHREPRELEVFIDTIITNNEERTVESVAKKFAKNLSLKQLRYISLDEAQLSKVLQNFALFNPNKEKAYVRRGDLFAVWNADQKKEEPCDSILEGITLLRRDNPDTVALEVGKGSETGIAYVCQNISEKEVSNRELSEVFGNPHASTLEILS